MESVDPKLGFLGAGPKKLKPHLNILDIDKIAQLNDIDMRKLFFIQVR
jgi:hypothetical protein